MGDSLSSLTVPVGTRAACLNAWPMLVVGLTPSGVPVPMAVTPSGAPVAPVASVTCTIVPYSFASGMSTVGAGASYVSFLISLDYNGTISDIPILGSSTATFNLVAPDGTILPNVVVNTSAGTATAFAVYPISI